MWLRKNIFHHFSVRKYVKIDALQTTTEPLQHNHDSKDLHFIRGVWLFRITKLAGFVPDDPLLDVS